MKRDLTSLRPREGKAGSRASLFSISTAAFFSCLWLVILTGALLLRASLAEAAPPGQTPDTLPSISGGRANWLENCAPCHGPTGQGDGPTAQSIEGPLPNFADPDAARRLVPLQNFDTIKNGRIEKLMPPWGNRFTDPQIWDLTAYVWRLSTTPADLEAGQFVYLEQCAACHGNGGAGDGPEAGIQMVDLTNIAMMVQASQADLFASYQASEQHAQLDALSDTEIWQALDHVRSFSFALPQRNRVLTGQAINATLNEPAGNIEVTLRVFDGNTEVETFSTQTASNGQYVFENLSDDPALLYLVDGQYQGITFSSIDFGRFDAGEAETTLNLNVYDTTGEAGAINVTQLHYIIAFTPETMNVLQIFVIANNGDRAYIGDGNGWTFPFALPEAAENVIFQNDPDGARFVQTTAGYADTRPIIPGRDGLSILATYDIAHANDTLTVEMPVPAQVAAVNLLMADQGVALDSEQLQFVETRQVQGETFSIFNGANLEKGDILTLRFSNIGQLNSAAGPGATAVTPAVDQNLLRWLMISLGGAAIIGVGVVYPLLRPRLARQPLSVEVDLARRKQRLLLTVARLDEIFEAGELDETVYRKARTKYTAELAEMLLNQ